ncbi:maleylpyruvate isomerase family mycothiol-dependent enzyme [Ornithinimicrobium sp. W1665]|uniref:maleylpyruvate isomerase family mycothiol-dependent enzyme n=1 Tax=Ornithinimicrobium sp. W1665 TaxID=3416666 RepID=UPI003CED16F6
MAPPLTRSLAWADEGTAIFGRALAGLSGEELDGPSSLQGWTRRHVVAHVAANAEALRNLVTWARTGVETPMYASMDQRNADIDEGALKPPVELREWFASTARDLRADLDALTDEQWESPVRTAQGRTIEATEVPWMRAREVMIHAADLGAGVSFADLPEGFLHDLVDDVVAQRTAAVGSADHPALWLHDEVGERTWRIGEPTESPAAPEVRGTAAQLAAYLTGRDADGAPGTVGGGPAPALPRWL